MNLSEQLNFVGGFMTESAVWWVRVAAVTINQFKSVVHGEIRLADAESGYDASILGLYGQNGSGKTALIQVLIGEPLPEKLWECINVGAETAHLTYELQLSREGGDGRIPVATVWYELQLGRRTVRSSAVAVALNDAVKTQTVIRSERLSFSKAPDGAASGFRKVVVMMTSEDNDSLPFLPKAKYEQLVGDNTKILVQLMTERKLADREGRSYLFSEVLSRVLSETFDKEKPDGGFKRWLNSVLRRLRRYGQEELFIIEAAQTGFVNLNALPLRINGPDVRGVVFLPLDQVTQMREELVQQVSEVIESLNIVLQKIVPGLTVRLRVLGKDFDEIGRKIVRVRLMSEKNAQPIPLQYESDGIKKIISILHLLVSVYNQPSVTVAVDELDSGIFEYLLGELLRIISENGQGQLIFTSHNLRPLETINKNFIAFTTANPSDCYTQMKNVRETNNLRSMYFRNLMLNADERTLLYRPTDNFEIARAFRQAGKERRI